MIKRYSLTNREDLQKFIDDEGFEFMKLNENHVSQLRNCQAWIIPVYAIKKERIYTGYVLQSYYTAVAISIRCYDNNDDIRIAFNKYSPTTSKQTTWFFRGYWD